MYAKDSDAPYEMPALDCVELEELLSEVLSLPAARRIVKSLVGEATITRSLAPKLLLERISRQELGLTPAQGVKLMAALRLGRFLFVPAEAQGAIVDAPVIAGRILNRLLGFESVEKFAVLVLDIKHRLLASQIVSSGTATETLAHPREVFGAVLRLGGTRCIVGHNHPSGSTEPSEEDWELTKALLQAGVAIQIPLLDHLIVSQGQFNSLRQATHLWEDIPQED